LREAKKGNTMKKQYKIENSHHGTSYTFTAESSGLGEIVLTEAD